MQARDQGRIAVVFDTTQTVGDETSPSYNVAHTHPVRVILERNPTRGIPRRARAPAPDRQMGFAPGLGKKRKMASKLIDARGETVTEKPSFRSSAAKDGLSYPKRLLRIDVKRARCVISRPD
ncbi:SOS response-associated peptidase family protein [Rhodococcus qingshengii]|uniref:SOS response-associated peptidase family protein n=1 Tax=Rhodococcus qingshengii TaxID=334542 RepID=UPI001BE66D2A|nr:SOS response-associated peptidase family protein [Rhodococcus qingshengii]